MPDSKDTDQNKNILIVGGDSFRDSVVKKMMTTKEIMDRMEEKIYKAVVMPPETTMPFPSFSMFDDTRLNDNPSPSTYANQSSVSSLSKEDILEQISIMERMLHEKSGKCGFNDAMPSPVRLGFHNFHPPTIEPLSLFQIYSNPYLTEQFRFPTSKKKRIRKKWSKDPRNFRPSRSVYVINKGRMPGMASLVCHPMTEVAITDAMKKFNVGTT